MFTTNKYVIKKITKPIIFLLVFFVSFFVLTEAEENFEIPVVLNHPIYFEYEQNINHGLLDMLTDSTYFSVEGVSSFYGKKFHNRRTSSGQRFDMHKYTAAHKKLPFGTIVRVTNLLNNRTSLAIINDRGPFVRKRIIDVSTKIANTIGSSGIPPVKISGITNEKHQDTNFFTGKYICFPLIKDVQLAEYLDVNFLKQMDNFSEAVELLHTLQGMNPNVPYCLTISANEYFSTRFERTYYVGILLHVMKSESIVIN